MFFSFELRQISDHKIKNYNQNAYLTDFGKKL